MITRDQKHQRIPAPSEVAPGEASAAKEHRARPETPSTERYPGGNRIDHPSNRQSASSFPLHTPSLPTNNQKQQRRAALPIATRAAARTAPAQFRSERSPAAPGSPAARSPSVP